MSKIFNIMIVGVGGQGSLLASRILGSALIAEGYDVKISEVHGMAQRGGSVVTYVRFGEKVYSPIIEEGEADIIIAFEQLEAARWLSYLKPEGILAASLQKISPMPVITGAAQYPAEIPEKIRSLGCRLIEIDALSLAEQAGSARAVNVVLIGILSRLIGLAKGCWISAIEASVAPGFRELNLRAFELGREALPGKFKAN